MSPRISVRRALLAGVLVLAGFAAGCPKGPVAVLPSIATQSDLRAVKDAFNADAGHRRVLVLLSPT